MQEHPLDDDDGVDWHFLDRGVDRRVGTVIEHPTPDSTISARTERVQYVLDESSQVVGVAEESLRRLPAEAVPGLPRSQEVVLVHDDCRSSGAIDRARECGSQRSSCPNHQRRRLRSLRDVGAQLRLGRVADNAGSKLGVTRRSCQRNNARTSAVSLTSPRQNPLGVGGEDVWGAREGIWSGGVGEGRVGGGGWGGGWEVGGECGGGGGGGGGEKRLPGSGVWGRGERAGWWELAVGGVGGGSCVRWGRGGGGVVTELAGEGGGG